MNALYTYIIYLEQIIDSDLCIFEVSCSSDYDTAADATETSSYVSAKGYVSR